MFKVGEVYAFKYEDESPFDESELKLKNVERAFKIESILMEEADVSWIKHKYRLGEKERLGIEFMEKKRRTNCLALLWDNNSKYIGREYAIFKGKGLVWGRLSESVKNREGEKAHALHVWRVIEIDEKKVALQLCQLYNEGSIHRASRHIFDTVINKW